VRERQHNILVDALLRQTKKHNISRAVAAGIGEEIILEAASFLGMECILLSEKYGRKISEIFPAYAAARLLAASSP
jgi:(4-(4-[2-(gamma-L-glutamylamino)ethyl]phenoxymethyl)furan-2-yl)methanamine synthase